MPLYQSLINRKKAKADGLDYITLGHLRELVANSNGLSDETHVYVTGLIDSGFYTNWKHIRSIMVEQFVKEDEL